MNNSFKKIEWNIFEFYRFQFLFAVFFSISIKLQQNQQMNAHDNMIQLISNDQKISLKYD